jgi:heme/copper-type cytochrome/quinol oxidase subunit 2
LKEKEQGVIMWLVVFMAVCSVPLIVLACICIWREKRWEKYNENQMAQPNA